MLKKTFFRSLALVCLLVLSACNQTSNAQTAEEIETFVTDTYTDVFAAYTRENLKDGMIPDRSVFDKKYLTKRLQHEIDSQEMIDVDYWLQAQDFTTPVFQIKDSHVTDASNGYVDIAIKVFGEKQETAQNYRVVVKKENGKWKIDDFYEYKGSPAESFK